MRGDQSSSPRSLTIKVTADDGRETHLSVPAGVTLRPRDHNTGSRDRSVARMTTDAGCPLRRQRRACFHPFLSPLGVSRALQTALDHNVVFFRFLRFPLSAVEIGL